MLYETNEYQLQKEDKVEGQIWGMTKKMVEQALKRARDGAIWGHKQPCKGYRCTWSERHFPVCQSIEQEGKVPEQWTKSYTIPVYKSKGDVLMVDKHRGVRLLEQEMKVYLIVCLGKQLRRQKVPERLIALVMALYSNEGQGSEL